MDTEHLQQLIRQELPRLLRQDPDFRAYVLSISQQNFADKSETKDWFTTLINELRRDREENMRKWEAQEKHWAEQNKKWEELQKDRDKKWEEQKEIDRKRQAEQNKKWEELQKDRDKKWEEQKEIDRKRQEEQKEKDRKLQADRDRRWEEQKQENHKLWEEVREQGKRIDRRIGALGARWGMQSEQSFRNALAGILQDNFGVKVVNVTEYDDDGEVFGRPDQVELDIIIKNGCLLICELKSSIDKAGMYIFERKARFYEKRHQRKADKLIVISPMIDKRAYSVAKELGIETYSDSDEVEVL